VTVRLAEADPVGGRLMFRLEGGGLARPRMTGTRQRRGLRRRR